MQGSEPRWLITDKLGSYLAAHRSVMPSVEHVTSEVHFSIVMSPEDLAHAGLEELGKKWG